MDSERSRNPILTKSITIGELTDSIIAKDYSSNPFLPLRQPYIQQFRPESAEMWKMNRRLSQKVEQQQQQRQQPLQDQSVQQLPPQTSHSQNKGSVNSKTVS